jgi:hypothetical protein
MVLCLPNDFGWRIRVKIQFLKASLRKMPVLAIFAAEVTTGTGEAEPGVTGDEMIEGRFFNRANVNDSRFSIDDGI